jgi:hypothetical protein
MMEKFTRFKILFPLSPPLPRTTPFFYNFSVFKITKKPTSSTKKNVLPDIFNSFYL